MQYTTYLSRNCALVVLSCPFFFSPETPVCAVPTPIPESGILCKRDDARNAFVKDVSRGFFFLFVLCRLWERCGSEERMTERKKKERMEK